VTDLSDDELELYARHIVLPQVGGVGQRRLKAARVAVVGAGGIGSAVIPALAGAGVGSLTIIDDDVVDLTNLHRQPIFRADQVGRRKADLAANFVKGLNSHVAVRPIAERLTANNAVVLLSDHDLVIDGCDNFATRLVVSDQLTRLEIPLVSAAAVQFQGQVALFRGWEADRPCYRCFVGDAFDSDDCDTCAEQGVLGALTGTVGSFAALVAIRAIVGIGADVAGRLFLFDGVDLAWRTIRLPKDPACRSCSA
jgi:molybdopterin-synthase adenylyltransferase